MKEVGEYNCTVSIKSQYVNDGVIFAGEADTSIGESATVRKFKFCITKKKITPTLALDADGVPYVVSSGDIYGGDTSANGRAPKIGFRYVSTDGRGYDSSDPPTAIGKYKAVATVTNDCPYETDGEISIDFELSKRRVVKPTVAGATSAQYNAQEQTFQLSNVADGDVIVTASNGAVYNPTDHTVRVMRAGKYRIRVELADSSATQWLDGKSAGYDLEIEITKKPLKVEITAPTSWNYGTVGTIRIVGDCLAGDRTELYMYCVKGVGNGIDPDAQEIDLDPYKTYDGSDYRTRIITIPADFAQGDYTLFVRLSNKNSFVNQNADYELSAQVKSVPFTVAGQTVTFTPADVRWQYLNDGATTVIGNGLQTAKLTYNGKAYSFSIDTSGLASKGVRIKTEQTGGYSGDTVATDAKSGVYTVTVYLTSLPGYADTNLSYTLTYEIAKAKYDLSGLQWNYTDAYPYDGASHGVTLVGTVPNGLTVTYSGNAQSAVGSYTTEVAFAIADAYRNNYVLPERAKSDSYTGAFDWTCGWQIVKATLAAVWKQAGGGNTVALPKLQPTDKLTNAMVEYVYYGADVDGNIDRSNVVTEAQILASGGGNIEVFYYAEAMLKAEYAVNYTLDFASADNPYRFSVGTNKSVLKLVAKIDGELLKSKYPYRGTPYVVTVEITVNEGNVPQDLILIDYYQGDTKLNGAPDKVGSYRVAISLKDASSAYIDQDCDSYTFEIEKARFDVSDLHWTTSFGGAAATYDVAQGKWVDALGREVRLIYDGQDHTVMLSGLDRIAGLSATVRDNVIRTAGTHTVTAAFVYDADNYHAPDFAATFAVTIEKKTVDTKDMQWGYTAGGSDLEKPYAADLIYTRADGNALVYTIRLIGVPQELQGYISYPTNGGTVRAASVAGEYRATFEIAADARDNYDFVLPASLAQTLDWKIAKRILKSPSYRGGWTQFDGTTHDLCALCDLAEGWQNYVTVTVKKDGVVFADPTQAYDAGVYTVSFDLIIVDSDKPNVEWQSETVPITIAVDRYTLYVTGWTGTGKDAVSQPDIATLPDFFEYRYTDWQGSPVDEATVDNTYSTAFRKLVVVKDAFVSNVTADGEIAFEFVTDAAPDSPVTFVDKPVLGTDTVVFDGRVHGLEDFAPTGLDSDVMVITVNADAVRDVGVYKVTVRFRQGVQYSWKTADGRIDKSAIELTLRIETLRLVKPTDGAQLPYNGREQVYLPEGLHIEFVTLTGNCATARGTYEARAALIDPINTCWNDGTTGDAVFAWQIVKGKVRVPAVAAPDDVTYNGTEYCLLDLIGSYDAALIEISGALYAVDAGVYLYTVAMRDADNYEWDDPSAGAGARNLEWTIRKVRLAPTWDKRGDTPVLTIPDAYADLVELEYVYYDANGNQVAADALAVGKSYTVVAKLAAGYEGNFEFVDADGNALSIPQQSEPESFEKQDPDAPSAPTVPWEWDNTKNPPEIKLPDDLRDKIHPEYEYKDKDGNIVDKDDLIDGEDYTVTVKIPDAEKDQIIFVDRDGNPIDIDNLPSHAFEKRPDGTDTPPTSGAGLGEPWFKTVMIVIAATQGAMLIVLIAIGAMVNAIRRMRRNRQNQS